jgi:hypothetical protein
MESGRSLVTFQRNVLSLAACVLLVAWLLFDPDDGGNMFF